MPYGNAHDIRKDVTIASGAAVSGSIEFGYAAAPRGLAVQVPGTWTAANIGVDFSTDGSTWLPLLDEEGNYVVITGVPTSTACVQTFPADGWVAMAYPYMRLHSRDTADDTDENQGGARSLSVILLY